MFLPLRMRKNNGSDNHMPFKMQLIEKIERRKLVVWFCDYQCLQEIPYKEILHNTETLTKTEKE
jgi:hypothetical protein